MAIPRLVDEADLHTFLGQIENAEIEYKLRLPTSDPRARIEFAKDVCAMANASGGVMLYGVEAVDGVATAFPGVTGDMDAESRRLRSILDHASSPRIPGVSVDPVVQEGGNPVLRVRVPRSWAAPHMVRGDGRFWIRRERQNAMMDVEEVRDGFMQRDRLAQQLMEFRESVLLRVTDQGIPHPMRRDTGMLGLYVLPWSSGGGQAWVDVDGIANARNRLPLLDGRVARGRYNVDGFLAFESGNNREPHFFTQLYRSGRIVAFRDLLQHPGDASSYLNHQAVADALATVPRFLETQRDLGVEPPVSIAGVILGVAGLSASVSGPYPPEGHPIDRNELHFPEVTLQSYEEDLLPVLSQMWDVFWNALGWPSAPREAKLRLTTPGGRPI